MSSMVRDLLLHGTIAAKAGDKLEAERYFKWLLRLNPSDPEKIEVYHWLADLSEDPAEKKNYIDEILARNPGDARARRKLAVLNGELDPAEIIDPDRLGSEHKTEPVPSDPQRFVCPTCGARMVYSPDGEKLHCENCGSDNEFTDHQKRQFPTREASFSAAMATARGHSRPANQKIVCCRGCGANFIIQAAVLSGNCPYCGSAYAETQAVEKQIVLPDLLIPFRLGLKEVREAIRAWFDAEKITPTPWVAVPIGYYLAVWTFDMGGTLTWTCKIRRNDRWEPVTDSKVLSHNDVMVAATNNLPEGLISIMESYNLEKCIPYDPRYLASWIAETYQVSIGDASLIARKIVLEDEKKRISGRYDRPVTGLKVDASSMTIDTYKLILLPIWLTSFQIKNDRFQAGINGQTGHVIGQLPAQGLSNWISELFDNSR